MCPSLPRRLPGPILAPYVSQKLGAIGLDWPPAGAALGIRAAELNSTLLLTLIATLVGPWRFWHSHGSRLRRAIDFVFQRSVLCAAMLTMLYAFAGRGACDEGGWGGGAEGGRVGTSDTARRQGLSDGLRLCSLHRLGLGTSWHPAWEEKPGWTPQRARAEKMTTGKPTFWPSPSLSSDLRRLPAYPQNATSYQHASWCGRARDLGNCLSTPATPLLEEANRREEGDNGRRGEEQRGRTDEGMRARAGGG